VQQRDVMCPAALDPASLCGRALVLPRIPRLQTPPPFVRGLRSYHVPHGFRPHLPAQEGSGATNVSHGSGPHPRTREGSRAITCPTTRGRQINKYSATTIRLQCTCVTEERSHGPRHLQDARAGGDIMTCKACRSRHYTSLL
jgi:hypothetical protein